MSWVRFDDKRALNRKLRGAGFAARGLDECAICWTSHEETDGFVSDGDLSMLAGLHGCRKPGVLVDALVSNGRWVRDDTQKGWWIVGYLEFNPSKAELESRRESDRNRKKKQSGFQPESEGNHTGSNLDSCAPLYPSRSTRSTRAIPPPSDPDGFLEFWSGYPRKVGRLAAVKAWKAAVKNTDTSVILDGVRKFATDKNLPEPQFIPHPSSWLRAGRWGDEALPGTPSTVRQTWISPHGHEIPV